jgi:hypothetical protein
MKTATRPKWRIASVRPCFFAVFTRGPADHSHHDSADRIQDIQHAVCVQLEIVGNAAEMFF